VLLSVEAAPAGPAGSQQVSFAVTDTGIGIPPERLDSLFTAFSQVDASTTREYGGTGLGLAISQRLVQAMGGQLTVSSTVGAGSRFTATVVLGVADATALPPAEPAPPARFLAGRRVLLADASATSRRVLSEQLRGLEVACVAVATGHAALARVQEFDWDAVVVDEQLPDVDAAALVAALRSALGRPDLPVVLLTRIGRGSPSGGLPASTAVSRPVKPSALGAALSGLLDPTAADVAAPAGSGGAGSTTPPPPPASASPSLRILLAEDNPVNQRVAQLLLAKLGHQVDSVANGEEAVTAARAGSYDLVLMDVQMPVLDGLAATRRIRSELPALDQPRIFALTASASVHDQDVCRAAGMDGHLPKPIREADLRRCLDPAATGPAAATVGPG
jgi:CheY-like chemotaxis protein